jgi:hypothetical protein
VVDAKLVPGFRNNSQRLMVLPPVIGEGFVMSQAEKYQVSLPEQAVTI